MVNECYLREGIRSFFKKKKENLFRKTSNYAKVERLEPQTLMPHRPLSPIVNSRPVLSPASPPASERWGCSPELLPCLPSHLPKDSRLFKTTPGRARECVGRGSSVGVDLALGSPFPRAACWIKGIGGISPSLCPVIGMQPFQ